MGDWFEEAVKRHLVGVTYGSNATVVSVDGFKGECSICKRRNKTSFIYEVSFKLKVTIVMF